MERALIVGRFQPFHKGHLAMVQYVMEQGYAPLIAIGSAQAHHTFRNPFTAAERKEMVEAAMACLPGLPSLTLPMEVLAMEDLFDPPRWAALALERLPPFAMVFSNDPVTITAFRDKGVEVRNIPSQQRASWQGRVIRAQMAAGDPAWRDAVPEEVVGILEALGAESRLAELRQLETTTENTKNTENRLVQSGLLDHISLESKGTQES